MNVALTCNITDVRMGIKNCTKQKADSLLSLLTSDLCTKNHLAPHLYLTNGDLSVILTYPFLGNFFEASTAISSETKMKTVLQVCYSMHTLTFKVKKKVRDIFFKN